MKMCGSSWTGPAVDIRLGGLGGLGWRVEKIPSSETLRLAWFIGERELYQFTGTGQLNSHRFVQAAWT